MRVITVLGPAQSGKSTLLGAIEALDGGRPLRFDVADAVGLSRFGFMDEPWAAFDIAGSADALPFAAQALAASDAAVLAVPAESEAAVLAAPWLRLVEEAGIPCFLFVNKMDATAERVRDVVAALQAYSSHSIVLRQVPIRSGGEVTGAVDLISERAWAYREGQPSALVELPADMASREAEARTELLESLADFDDALLEQLIEDQRPLTGEVYDLATRVLRHNDLISAYLGAASHANGVFRLMKALRHEAPHVADLPGRLGLGEATALACLADVRKHLGKVTVLRAVAGDLRAGEPLGGETLSTLTALDTKTPVKSLGAGEVGLAVKSDHIHPGSWLSAAGSGPLPDWTQAHPGPCRQLVTPANDRDDVRLSVALARLSEIDPGATVDQDPGSGKPILASQSALHARRLSEKLAAEFGVPVALHPVPPAFRETINGAVEHHHRHRKQSGGAGQFADVLIEVRPAARGAGFSFAEVVKGGAVPRNYIPAVEAGARDALSEGPNGCEVVDVEVVLKDGKHHAVDSSDFAFRTAGKAALRAAFEAAGTTVLQPIVRIDIHVPSVFAGGLVPVVSGLKGQVLGFEGHPTATGWDVFSARLPAAGTDELLRALAGATRGTAWFVSRFDHYEPAQLADLEAAQRGLAEA